MTEPKRPWLSRALCLAAVLLLLGGSLLPLWSKNGVTVNAWQGDYLSVGRWLLVVAMLGGLAGAIFPAWRGRATLLGLCGGLALLQAGLILWQGYKLEAIGLGAWVVLVGAAFQVAGSR